MTVKRLLSLMLAGILAAGTAAAAWSPVDFSGGSLSGIAADGDTVLVSDVFNKVVWRVEEGGAVTRAAGQISIPGLDGEPVGKYDDGTLESALFMEPWAVAPFLEGWAVSDSAANVVRWFSENGVYTAAGSGTAGSAGGRGVRAEFDRPTGLAAGDSGELYIADTGNGAIRVMDEDGRVSTYVSGLLEPMGLCWSGGALYVAETGKNRICRIVDGEIQVFAGAAGPETDGVYEGTFSDGPADRARFDHPQGVAVGEDGSVYVADTGNGAVRKIKDGEVITLARPGETPQAPVQPRGILVQGDSLLVSDLFARNLLEIDLSPVSFSDVPGGAWYSDALSYAAERGIAGAGADGGFRPDDEMLRADVVDMLSRIHLYTDGNAVIDGESSFSDTPPDAPYAEAVRWAADHGIVGGYGDGSFGPGDPVTREQFAAILRRWAEYTGFGVSGSEDRGALNFTDAGTVSGYALSAVQWAVGTGVMEGFSDGSLRPAGTVTRAQVVVMLKRFCENVLS